VGQERSKERRKTGRREVRQGDKGDKERVSNIR